MSIFKRLAGKKEEKKITPMRCSNCSRESGFVGYAPKEGWDIHGNLCAKCYAMYLARNKPSTGITEDHLDVPMDNSKPEVVEKEETSEDPLSVLKMRLAKGEITKEVFLELSKILVPEKN